MRVWWVLPFCLSFGIVLQSAAVAASSMCGSPRLALVLGERSYPDSDTPLLAPVENARGVARALDRLGFTVATGEDLTRAQIDDLAHRFTDGITPGAMVVLFFSGIGLQSGGHTYLVPIDAAIWSEADVRATGVDVESLLADMSRHGAKVRIVVIDAARRNPFERRFRSGGSMGLAPISGAADTLAMFSDVPGAVFEDTIAGASPFVLALTHQIAAPDASAEDAFQKARAEMSRMSGSVQRPWISSSLNEDVVLDGRMCRPSAAPTTPSAALPPRHDAHSDDLPARPPAERPSATAPTVDTHADKAADKDAATAFAAPDAARPSAPAQSERTLDDPVLLREIRDRLFEQDLDPGEPGSPEMSVALRAFQRKNGLPDDGVARQSVLQALREASPLRPWGAIVFAQDAKSWGMSWQRDSRVDALADARARCGTEKCTRVLSFYGRRCGAFALSSRSWVITWRNGAELSRNAALGACAKGGAACRLVGAVCADGSDRKN